MGEPDPQLLVDCMRSDRRAQNHLYRHCYPVLMRVISRYVRDEQDAAPLVNQAFLNIIQSLDKKKEGLPFEAWARRIGINVAIDAFRKQQRRREKEETVELHLNGYAHTSDLNLAELNFSAETLEAMIRSLPEVSRQVFNLHALDGYPYSELAEMLQMTESTARWHVTHARQRLKNMIAATTSTKKSTHV